MKILTIKWIGILALVVFASQAHAEEQLVLKSRNDKQDYSTGVSIVRNLKQQGGQVNLNVVIKGMLDELTGERLLMSEEDLLRTIADLKMTRPLDQAADKRDDEIKPDTAGSGTKDDFISGQKQGRPEPQADQAGQNDRLATAGYAGRADASAMQHQTRAEQLRDLGYQLTPEGHIMSWRNQAKLSVAELKAEMRARVASEAFSNRVETFYEGTAPLGMPAD